MTISAPTAEPRTPALTQQPRGRLVRWAGWALLACWLFVVVQWFLAPAPARWADFESSAAKVDSVQIFGGHDRDASLRTTGESYAAMVRIVWHQGWRTYETAVVETTAVKRTGIHYVGSEESGLALVAPFAAADAEVKMRDVRAEVEARVPHATVTRADLPDTSSTGYGRSLPSWVLWLGLITGLGSLAHLILAPTPWRATRWAWFWLSSLPLVGVPIYLLSSGATLQRPPSPWARPLTGGIAFILAMILGAMLTTAIS
ncbi:DUF368 domain-containing protein [Nocardioides daejeonensis]|uniref:DUF368 domain-containing protein n=1 Tax=Nocardioides daejeonensis TaxID=1046556 RepID=UPI001EF605D3|nr:DUF368 domain-containing protein [Nocardioides daejeonensis]